MLLRAGLLHGIEARAARPEYGQLLGDCQRAYCAARLVLVGGVTHARMAALAREPLPTLTRSGCAYLMQVPRRCCVVSRARFRSCPPLQGWQEHV